MIMKQFIVETSARHVHVSQADLETLFGAGYQLTPKKDLSQPGQYACAERVDVVGPKKTLTGVSILGPVRKETQVEISLNFAAGANELAGAGAGSVAGLTDGGGHADGAGSGRYRCQASHPHDSR